MVIEDSSGEDQLHITLGTDDENLKKIKHINEQCDYHTNLVNAHFHDKFSILHMNTRSMKNKLEEINNFLLRSKAQWDIICISETWLKDDILEYYKMENYNFIASCRPEGEGGGTAIYIRTKHEVRERKDLESNNIQTNFVQVKLHKKVGVSSVLVGEIYKPPSYSNNAFLTYLEGILSTIEDEKRFAIITGDFNYNLLTMNQNKCNNDFATLMASYGFYPMISKATRKQKQTETLLDNIFVNNLALYHSSGIIVDDLSDHLPIYLSLKIANKDVLQRNMITVFDTRKMEDLCTFLKTKLLNFQNNTDANAASEQIAKAYAEGIQQFSKTYKSSRRKSSMKPWITPSILCSINRKTQLYNKFLRRGNQANENKYKHYRNVLVKTIRDAKKLYFQNELEKAKQDGKATWSVLNKIINKTSKKETTFPETFYDSEGKIYMKSEVPDGFNVYFSTIGETLDKEIPTTSVDPIHYLTGLKHEPCDVVPQITVNEVEKIINSLNNVAGGIDKISTKILSGTYKSIIHHLTFFFNLCLRNAVFPYNLKVAIIIPIHKAGTKDRFTNYRPISLLPILSKILEKILHSTLSSFLEEQCILYPFQFGFRKKHSTYMPITHMYDEITKNLFENELTCVLYLDLKKAFDTVSVQILLKKIHLMGIRGSLYKIIESYLNSRYQTTKINNVLSRKEKVVTGVPQGSILGPLLFILYINDMPKISELGNFYIFADDTAVMVKAGSADQLQSKINQLLPNIAVWFQANRLTLNATKSNYQIFSRNKVGELNIMLQNELIERKACVRYLGVYIDENLKWHSHIAHVVSTISRNLGIMGRAKYLLASRDLMLLYNSLILPHLSYCAMVWGRTYETNIKKITLLQKRALRIVDKKPYLYPSNDLFIKHKVLKFKEMVKEQNIMILLALINNTLPSPIARMFKKEVPTNTRQTKHFAIPAASRNYRLFALSCSAPRLWNDIIASQFRYLESVPKSKVVLKKLVRRYFLEKYKKSTTEQS